MSFYSTNPKGAESLILNMQLGARSVFLSALVGLVVLAGTFFAAAAQASAVGPRNKSDCPNNTACLWEGPTFGGNRAFFAASDGGCHSLANINPRSAYNNTNNRILNFPTGVFVLFPLQSFSNLSSGYAGVMCIE